PARAGWPDWSGRRDATGAGADVAGVDVAGVDAGADVAGGDVAGVDVARGVVADGCGVGGDPPHAVSTAQTPPSVTRATDDFTSGPPCWAVRPPASEPRAPAPQASPAPGRRDTCTSQASSRRAARSGPSPGPSA